MGHSAGLGDLQCSAEYLSNSFEYPRLAVPAGWGASRLEQMEPDPIVIPPLYPDPPVLTIFAGSATFYAIVS